MRRLAATTVLLLLCLAPVAATQTSSGVSEHETEAGDGIAWRDSISVGKPNRGSLFFGVQFPSEGTDYFTWDFPLRTAPNRPWRRWGNDDTIRVLLRVIAEYRLANPGAPRVGVADLSRPLGGPFGARYGGLGHASHQNGLDVDVLYPRRDGAELDPAKAARIDRGLSQDLVDRFVAAGAQYVFVGPRTKLTGPKRIVQKLAFHDDHMHVRFFARAGGRRQ
ncbi:MAG TPA: penicillin-insensitive murein endopeptidase [Solirubrobacterales bacterium]|jgi:murein endopeptidase|nr:penicillin-insensitive murein endopeptidase [Solirubrobacterales bacterium]